MLRVESLRKIIYILLSIKWKDALKLTKSLRFTENVKTWIANQSNKQYIFEKLNVSQLREGKNVILNLNLFPLYIRHALLVVALKNKA